MENNRRQFQFNIREIRQDDYLALHKVWCDPEVIKFTLTGDGMTVEQAYSRVEKVISDSHEYTVVADVPEIGVVGIAGLIRSNLNKQTHTAMLYVSIGSHYHGGGIGSACLKALIEFAQREGIKVIHLKCHIDNVAAIRLYKKFEFEIEGVLRKRTNVNGSLKDLFVMSKLL
jgi:RimJ/RimL family protein N-acetyltransferase